MEQYVLAYYIVTILRYNVTGSEVMVTDDWIVLVS